MTELASRNIAVDGVVTSTAQAVFSSSSNSSSSYSMVETGMANLPRLADVLRMDALDGGREYIETITFLS